MLGTRFISVGTRFEILGTRIRSLERLKKTCRTLFCSQCDFPLCKHNQWRAEMGGERGDGPGHPRQGGIQRVKL